MTEIIETLDQRLKAIDTKFEKTKKKVITAEQTVAQGKAEMTALQGAHGEVTAIKAELMKKSEPKAE